MVQHPDPVPERPQHEKHPDLHRAEILRPAHHPVGAGGHHQRTKEGSGHHDVPCHREYPAFICAEPFMV